MQPTLVREIETEGSLPGKVTPMGIQQKDMPHIMGVLTRQYSDPAMAVLREYSANARDEHILLGISRPIEVTLPNRFNTSLTIKDYGRGMSVEFVEDRYSQYGDSEKRDDPNQIGGFGIGGKAALSYTDSFTLTTVKDGVKGHFVISRDKNGAGSVKTMPDSGTLTTEENYTEIKVPAKDVDDFTSKAAFLFKFWPEGSVIVNGEAPRRHSGIPVTDKIWYAPKSDGVGQSYIVMGGVPYRVANSGQYLTDYYLKRFHFVAEVGMEECAITPSREDLEYTDLTIATLNRVGKEFAKGFIDMVKKEIADQPTSVEAFDKWGSWVGQINAGTIGEVKYKGEVIADHVDIGSAIKWNRNSYRRSRYGNITQAITVNDARNALFITGRKDDSSYTKARVRMWLEKQPFRKSLVYFVDKVPTSPWVENLTHATWDDILSVKPPKRNAPGQGQYAVLDPNGYGFVDTDADELKDLNKILLVTPQDYRSNVNNASAAINLLTTQGQDVTLVKLPENRWAKFKKNYPDAENFFDYIDTQLALMIASVPKSEWEHQSLDSHSRSIIRKLDASKCDDPEIAKIKSYMDKKKNSDIRDIDQLAAWTGRYKSYQDKIMEDWFAKRYPLISGLYYGNFDADELTIYLNAAYAARKDK